MAKDASFVLGHHPLRAMQVSTKRTGLMVTFNPEGRFVWE